MTQAPRARGRSRTPAAQYLRMSTEHQRYSTENQAAAIAAYARLKGYAVVRTYSDDGVSGLRLKNRKSLQQLLADTVGGSAGFEVILVYDVSRWGRFQNPDQSAHYEFLCSEAGVPVQYCAEGFENDGSLSSTLLKSLKRVMAAEFSRELSAKVTAGKKRLARKGYWQQGMPGLGLRRRMVDEQGRPGAVLEFGQRKAIQSHHVILTPGPDCEIALVNRIYRLFVVTGMTRRGIMRLLNAEGLTTDLGHPWSFHAVTTILTDPKYIGDLVFNRMSVPLGGKPIHHPKADWSRSPGAFEAIVPRRMFEAAQEILRTRQTRMPTEQMLPALARVLAARGELSEAIISETIGLPGVTAFRKRFGGMLAVYAALGYEGPKVGARCGGMSDEDLLRRLAALLEREGRLSVKIVDQARGLPCSSTYARRFGSAQAAFALAGHVQMTPAERASPVGQARMAAALAARNRSLNPLQPREQTVSRTAPEGAATAAP